VQPKNTGSNRYRNETMKFLGAYTEWLFSSSQTKVESEISVLLLEGMILLLDKSRTKKVGNKKSNRL
tara:strand:- start:504 stop:704 length:201 start_codon:yes stop_codon:yes gene_type:complete